MSANPLTLVSPELALAREALEIALPDPTRDLTQDEEWFVVRIGDQWRRLRLHDYDEIFEVQGLYERVVYDILQTVSPEVVGDLFEEALRDAGQDPASMVVMDLGAGNGCVAEALSTRGLQTFVGVDISQPGALAAYRDRPGLYTDYVVADLCAPRACDQETLEQYKFNALACVAALGFGDIPPAVFAAAFNQIEDEGWIVFTIKADFLEAKVDGSGFAAMVRAMIKDGTLEIAAQKRYQHRVNTAGDGLEYVAFVGRKQNAINPGLVKVS
jgi:predicted TPR repeat methyltransferase